MPDDDKIEHIDECVEECRSQVAVGQGQDAALSMPEASTLKPDEARVMEAWDALNAYRNESETLNVCKGAFEPKDETSISNWINAATDNNYTAEDAARCMRLLLEPCNLDSAAKTQIITAISKNANGAKGLAKMLHEYRADTFGDLWILGDACVDILVRIAVTHETWFNEQDRSEVLRGLFTLFLAKLLEPDAIYQETAMRSIARLMAADAPLLLPLIGDENLEIILSFLGFGQPVTVKSQATLAIAKFLEISSDSGKSKLKDYLISRFTKHSSDDIIAAVSVAAIIFPIIPDMAAYMFLTPKFVEDLLCMTSKSCNHLLCQATLELLSAACVDRGCRIRIKQICVPWLEETLDSSSQGCESAMAGLVLSKVLSEQTQDYSGTNRNEQTLQKVVSMFKVMIINSPEADIQTYVEGLAYNSIHTRVKEQLANDQAFLRALIKMLFDSPKQGPLIFGGMTIISNLTAYARPLSAEEKRLAQLKAYANQMKLSEPNPMDDETHVTMRCRNLIDAGVAAVFGKTIRQASPVVLNIIASILLSLSHERKHCGIMVQHGLSGVILQLAHIEEVDAAEILLHVRRKSAHALAKILISVPPELFFASVGRTVNECIGPLNFLMSPVEPQDPYCPFDALRALTNIASFSEASASLVSDMCFSSIAVYLQASRSAQQQAAAECICNLSHSNYFLLSHYVFASDEGDPFGQDFDIENPSTNPKEVQFQRLILLTSSKTRGTRIAAMGALAVMVGTTLGRRMLIQAPNGLEHVMAAFSEAQNVEAGEAIGLTGEDAYLGDVDMRTRAACVVYEVCCNTEEINVHRRLVRHGLMKLLTEGAKHLPREKPVRDQLVAYMEPVTFKLKEVFKK